MCCLGSFICGRNMSNAQRARCQGSMHTKIGIMLHCWVLCATKAQERIHDLGTSGPAVLCGRESMGTRLHACCQGIHDRVHMRMCMCTCKTLYMHMLRHLTYVRLLLP